MPSLGEKLTWSGIHKVMYLSSLTSPSCHLHYFVSLYLLLEQKYDGNIIGSPINLFNFYLMLVGIGKFPSAASPYFSI